MYQLWNSWTRLLFLFINSSCNKSNKSILPTYLFYKIMKTVIDNFNIYINYYYVFNFKKNISIYTIIGGNLLCDNKLSKHPIFNKKKNQYEIFKKYFLENYTKYSLLMIPM